MKARQLSLLLGVCSEGGGGKRKQVATVDTPLTQAFPAHAKKICSFWGGGGGGGVWGRPGYKAKLTTWVTLQALN